MLFVQDISPEQTCKRRTEGCAEGTVVDTDGHAVHRGPECPIGYGNAVVRMYLLPRLDDAGEQDGGADIRTRKL